MSINFGDLLSVEQKQALLEGKIQQLALEGYQLQVNRVALQSVQGSEEALAVLDSNLLVVEKAVEAYQQEIENLR